MCQLGDNVFRGSGNNVNKRESSERPACEGSLLADAPLGVEDLAGQGHQGLTIDIKPNIYLFDSGRSCTL